MSHNATFIPGKDASLETAIDRMQTRLQQLGFNIEERSWLNPVDDVWSVHIRETSCPLMFTNGKGASKLAALASALGEFIERLACQYFWSHYYLGEAQQQREHSHYPQERWFPLPDDDSWPAELLTPQLQALYNPDDSIPASQLVDYNSGDLARGICALPYTRLSDNATVWFPVNLIGNLFVSNGMSAGNTRDEARAQALSEIFERAVKFRVIREGWCLPEVPEAVINRYPKIAAGIAGLRAAGFGILVKDASLGGQYPVMCVTLLHPVDQGCYCSFGAHPRFEIALERALTELLQGRALDALGGFPAPGFDLDEIAQAPNLEIHFVDSSGQVSWNFLGNSPDFAFHDWNFSQSTADDYSWLCQRLARDGLDAYVADFEHLGFYACRILVPGFSEIYPIDDLEWENSSVGNAIRPALQHLHDLKAEACAELLATFNALGIDDQRPVAAVIGLAADEHSAWSTLRIGELRTLLALACGDRDAIREGCDWVNHMGQLPEARAKVYRCIATLLDMEDHRPYAHSLPLLFGADTVATAQALLAGKSRFFDLEPLGANFENSTTHRALLAAYAKAHAARLAAHA